MRSSFRSSSGVGAFVESESGSGHMWSVLGNWEEAVTEYTKEITALHSDYASLTGSFSLYYGRANALVKQKKYGEALADSVKCAQMLSELLPVRKMESAYILRIRSEVTNMRILCLADATHKECMATMTMSVERPFLPQSETSEAIIESLSYSQSEASMSPTFSMTTTSETTADGTEEKSESLAVFSLFPKPTLKSAMDVATTGELSTEEPLDVRYGADGIIVLDDLVLYKVVVFYLMQTMGFENPIEKYRQTGIDSTMLEFKAEVAIESGGAVFSGVGVGSRKKTAVCRAYRNVLPKLVTDKMVLNFLLENELRKSTLPKMQKIPKAALTALMTKSSAACVAKPTLAKTAKSAMEETVSKCEEITARTKKSCIYSIAALTRNPKSTFRDYCAKNHMEAPEVNYFPEGTDVMPKWRAVLQWRGHRVEATAQRKKEAEKIAYTELLQSIESTKVKAIDSVTVARTAEHREEGESVKEEDSDGQAIDERQSRERIVFHCSLPSETAAKHTPQ